MYGGKAETMKASETKKLWYEGNRCASYILDDDEIMSMSAHDCKEHMQSILDEVYNCYMSYYNILYMGDLEKMKGRKIDEDAEADKKVDTMMKISEDLDVLFYAYLLMYGDEMSMVTKGAAELAGVKDRANDDAFMHFKRCLAFDSGENYDGTYNIYDYV